MLFDYAIQKKLIDAEVCNDMQRIMILIDF